jgi:hypothetical protein
MYYLCIKINEMEYTNNNAFTETRNYSNNDLRELLREVKEISGLDAPRHTKKSDKLETLFKLEKTQYNSWADQFSNVRRAIEIEILDRVTTGII